MRDETRLFRSGPETTGIIVICSPRRNLQGTLSVTIPIGIAPIMVSMVMLHPQSGFRYLATRVAVVITMGDIYCVAEHCLS